MVKDGLIADKEFSYSVNHYLSEAYANFHMDSFEIIRAIAALIITISLLLGIALAVKKFGLLNGQFANKPNNRLKIIESLWLDGGKSRLLLIEFDETETLILLSQNGATLVEKRQKSS